MISQVFTIFFLHSTVDVLVTLTTDVGRLLSKLHQVQPKGNIKFNTAVKVAHVGLLRHFLYSVIHSVFQTLMYHLVPLHASLFFHPKLMLK